MYLLRSPKLSSWHPSPGGRDGSWRTVAHEMGRQGLVDGLLPQSVNHGGDTNRRFAIVLRYRTRRTGFGRYEPSCRNVSERSLIADQTRKEFLETSSYPGHPPVATTAVQAWFKLSGTKVQLQRSAPCRMVLPRCCSHPLQSAYPLPFSSSLAL